MSLPKFEGPIEGYVVNYLTKNHWRIKNTHDHLDAKQEAYAVFLRCAAKYPTVEPAHFMALFKTAWHNEFVDLSHKATAVRNEVAQRLFEDETEADMVDGIVGELDNDGALAVMIRQAPKEVLMVLNLFLTAPVELLELAGAAWLKQGKYRADGDRAVARMLGLPPDSKPMTETQRYFGQSPD